MSKEVSTVVYKGKSFPKYIVDTNGKIRNKDTNNELKAFDDDRGYDCVDLMNNSGDRCRAKVHLIVAHTYLGKQEKDKVVQHKDGNKKNNKLSNLEYITYQENVKHAQTKIRGLEYLSEAKRDKIKELHKNGKTLEEIARKLDIKAYVVRDFLQGKTYN